MNKNNKINYITIEGNVAIITNIILAILKYWVSITSGSLALAADAWHTLSDSLSSAVLLLSNKLSNKPADKEHPFGHGRFEIIGTIIIGLMLAIVGYNFLINSIVHLNNHTSAHFGLPAIIITIVSIVTKELMAQFAFWTAKKEDNSMLKADAWHHRSDALSSLVILVGIFLGKQYWWIDSALALLLSVMIFYVAGKIMFKSIYTFLGEAPTAELKKNIIKIAEPIINDIDLHHLHIHRYGKHLEATFHVSLPGHWRLDKAHTKVDILEKKIKQELSIESTIHIDPS